MIVKRCTTEDIDKIYNIEETAFSDPLKKETILADLMRENYYCYGLYDGDLAAFLSYERVLDEAQIISVATEQSYRRKGYARVLFENVCEMAKAEGISLFTLEVRMNNHAAIALYESLGFKAVGVRKNYYTNPVCDAMLMDLYLRED